MAGRAMTRVRVSPATYDFFCADPSKVVGGRPSPTMTRGERPASATFTVTHDFFCADPSKVVGGRPSPTMTRGGLTMTRGGLTMTRGDGPASATFTRLPCPRHTRCLARSWRATRRPDAAAPERLSAEVRPRGQAARLSDVEAVQVHHLGPCSHEVLHELLLRVVTCIDFRDRPQLRV
jgi:hypothetical protein